MPTSWKLLLTLTRLGSLHFHTYEIGIIANKNALNLNEAKQEKFT